MRQEIISEFIKKNSFSVRPNAESGIWVFFLLPISLIVSLIRHPIILTPTYKLATLTSLTLFCNSLYVILCCYKKQRLQIFNVWPFLISLLTSSLFNICLHKGWLFSIANGSLTTVLFLKIYCFIMTKLKQCFTLGEGGLVAQGFVLFMGCICYNIYFIIANINNKYFVKSNMQISTIIIQAGLLGILSLAFFLYKLQIRSTKGFYILAFVVLSLIVMLPLHIILEQSPVLWIFSQVLGDIPLLKLFIYWSFCIGLAILAVKNQIFYARKASTGVRKIFHILAVLVYIPGLYYRCSFLYLSTGVILGVFLALEILRILLIPPLGSQLQEGFIVFNDEKDTGLIALTPIYLLTGLSLPIWLHPSPCDVTDSAQFTILPLLSGLLAIGIGDTSASYIGSNFGRLKWKGTSKTLEGTLACFLSQLGFIYLLYYLGCLSFLNIEHVIRITLGVFATSVIEAFTSQIDNIVLPLVMYIFLI
ncbi:dolichol kinase [Rhynchophorus ferrugineus]|uniref:dolichol kinase n=1 Tax=Rhynchophorus ferrugineus TaxID=354439 RepID=A0A834IKS6_RHYFE|nr:hypothetical protein GWI33_004489 [Rhynchophorus ferrugineus]